MPLPPPDVLVAGRYRLVQRIAEGGMGSVWEAWDELLRRRVALKQLHPQPGLNPADAQLAANRAMREGRITARLHHPHAVQVYDVVDFDGQPCLIMQYLPSKSLQALVAERGPLDASQVARIGSQVATALAAAHAAGIVHRDVKPGNVLIGEDGAAKITDFGISHATGDESLTSTGMVTGTPAFLAPEVARGVDSSPATDVFSLGSTLYAALEGRPPFGTEENPMAMLHRVASGEIVPPRHTGPLTSVLMRMLATDPAARPPMSEVAGMLAAVANSESGVAGAPTQRINPTQRMPAPPPAAPVPPPPTTTVTLPAAHPVRRGPEGAAAVAERRPRRTLPIVAGILVLLIVGLGILLVTQLSGGDNTANPPATTGSPGRTQHTAAGRHSTSHTEARTTPTNSTPPSSPESTQITTQSTQSTQSTRTAAGSPTAADLIDAIRSYYALLPDDTASAWNRLTPEYQQGSEAGGRGNYEQFWHTIQSVSVSNESADPANGTVLATVSYVTKGGDSSSERRTFQLVRQDGVLKIADSSPAG